MDIVNHSLHETTLLTFESTFVFWFSSYLTDFAS